MTQTTAEPTERQRLYRRTLRVVVVSQVFGGAGLAAGVTVGALLAEDMLGTDRFAGLPSAVFALGAAASALLVGRLSQRRGRRTGLSAGFLAGGIGAAGVVLAAVLGNVPLLFVSLLAYGAGISTNLQARYAGTDLAEPRQRGTAVSVALVSTTLGAVAGPNLVPVTGQLAVGWGIPALAGPFLLASAAYLVAGILLFVFLRPDPFLVAKAWGAAAPPAVSAPAPDRVDRGVLVGASVMVLTQLAMVAIMTMTPVQMRAHGHGLSDVGLVIGLHIGAMYLPSLVTGTLVDKVGRVPMSIASGVTLLLAGTVAALAPPDSMPVLIVALVLLGLGWNFGLISGTAMIVDATSPATRAKTQGNVDVLVALSGATGGALSGMVVAGSSYAVLSLGGGLLALLLIPVVAWSRRGARAATG
ncbi:MFS transporter [Cryobacterium tepidiphilum]|uniref:MFS transporter n=1 Tax=Cryobacterium tepidiphilum TaxID=2486026 RepID=UPI0018F30603|nr:MFS transporter [Cryobacterium tepidiphilum]